jgi:formate dehydrogenase major subunit
VPAPPGVRDDLEIIFDLAGRLGHDWGKPDSEAIWNELRSLSPMHAGMSYKRLEESGGLQWPCYDESHPGEMFLHGRLWADPLIGPRAPFSVVHNDPPVDRLDHEFPIRLTTGRRLDSYNTGVQTEHFASPLRREEALDLSPEDGARYHLQEGEKVRVSSRRGSVIAPVRFDPGLRSGLAFLDIHSHQQIATNDLTVDAVDPRSGTAEFKASAIRIEKVLKG